MTLAQKMKLQELKNQIDKLSIPRTEVIALQKATVAEKIKSDTLAFFTSKGFDIQGQIPKITASYQGGLQTLIDFSGLTEGDFRSSGSISLKYEKKEFSLEYSINRGKLPRRGTFAGSPESVMQQEIDFYEKELIPAMKDIGVSDLNGDITIFSITAVGGNKTQRMEYQSIDEALGKMIC